MFENWSRHYNAKRVSKSIIWERMQEIPILILTSVFILKVSQYWGSCNNNSKNSSPIFVQYNGIKKTVGNEHTRLLKIQSFIAP